MSDQSVCSTRRGVIFLRISRVASHADARQNIAFLDELLLTSLGDGRPKGSGRGERVRRPVRRKSDPDHNLWNNNGVWFVIYTIHPTSATKERRCESLKTRCVETARQRRDQIFAQRDAEGTLARSPRSPRG